MPQDVLITPASALVQFKENAGAVMATLQLSSSNVLNITGNVSVGTAGGNVLIGDGVTAANIVYEQGGAIYALSTKTLTIGTSGSFISLAANVSSGANITGNVISGNLSTTGLISATGNITGGNILGGANVNATTHTGTTVSVTGNVNGGNLIAATLVQGTTLSASGNVIGGNITTAGLISSTGNVTGSNIRTAGTVSATGNVTGNYILGNGSQLTGITSTSTEIINGTSNVSINSANANVNITVAGATNSSVFSPGSLFTGILAVPKTLTGNVVMAANSFGTIINGTVITGNLQIPDGTTVYTWTPS